MHENAGRKQKYCFKRVSENFDFFIRLYKLHMSESNIIRMHYKYFECNCY